MQKPLTDTVYEALQATFEQVREPGKSGLVVFPLTPDMATFTEEIGGIEVFRQALTELAETGRIYSRKMNYPADIPEAYSISFL